MSPRPAPGIPASVAATASSAASSHDPVPGGSWRPILGYQLRVYRRNWRGSLVGRVVTPLLTLVALGFGLGTLIDRAGGAVPWGGVVLAYVPFVAPGMVAGNAMLVAFGDSSWPVLGAIRWQGTYHAMLATPATPRDILRAHGAFVALQLTVSSSVFLAVAAAFGAVRSWWAVAAVPVVVLCGLGFAGAMTALAAWTETETAFTLAYRLGMTPLMLFSGTFFPVDQLPRGLAPLAWMTPLWHGVETARALCTGLIDGWSVAGHVTALAAFVVAGAWLADRSLRRRLVV